MTDKAADLAAVLGGTPYVAYLYSYPHKTAYRDLEPALPLRRLWAAEKRDALFFYLHIPFCEMRCGYCNLFTSVGADRDLVGAYLDALEREAARVRDTLGRAKFAQMAIGGGTPTFLDPEQLGRVLDLAEGFMGTELGSIPVSVETSPQTATAARLAVLVGRGVDRVSIGIESFIADEVRAVGRAQTRAAAVAAVERIRASGVDTLNIDLMYGLPGQTIDSWLESIVQALEFAPEELYLYPLYVRPLTGLGRSSRAAWDDLRLQMYRTGRELLVARGYEQVSMRMFRSAVARQPEAAVYRCQEDGMVGLGAGARSYTEGVHYSTEYAVANRTIKSIIRAYVDQGAERFENADYGVVLDDEDRRRRYAILSLLGGGIDVECYRRRFGDDLFADLPQLSQLEPLGLAESSGGRLVLTSAGVERSDAIGPWLFSARVRSLMKGYRQL